MKSASRKLGLQRKTISLVLVVAFLSLTLFPYHLHLHHAHDTTGGGHAHVPQAHVVDAHMLGGADDFDHHDDSHTIEPATDMSLKTFGFHLPVLALILMLWLILPFNRQECRQRLELPDRKLPRYTFHPTPPLRAPPRP